jgi:hypothetical protein
MLKAVIIYVQGTGGNLLARTLTLCESTIPYVPRELAEQQPTLHATAKQRLEWNNNWNAHDWTETELSRAIWYRKGLQEFVNYELSELNLIDYFHPMDFERENGRQLLWTSVQSWQHLIYIRHRTTSLPLIKTLADRKRRDLKHVYVIESQEMPKFHQLRDQYPGLTIDWEDMLSLDTYLIAIQRLAQALKLELDYTLVQELWTSWKQATDEIINNE